MNAFYPPRQRGLALHFALLILFGIASLVGLFNAFQTEVGPSFAAWILLGVGAFAPLPFLGYRAYSLLNAHYILDRETLRLKWGLRNENIPLSNIEWVRPVSDLTNPLRLPAASMPGALLGKHRHPDLGLVEFLASQQDHLLLVATAKAVFVISPENPSAFTIAFQHAIELGSLSASAGSSQYPSFVISQAWESPLVRFLWLSGLLLNIGLLVWTATLIPTLSSVAIGFDLRLQPRPAFAPVQLILLPLISFFLFFTSWASGLFFLRREEKQLSLAVWGSSTLSALFFIIAVIFLLTASV